MKKSKIPAAFLKYARDQERCGYQDVTKWIAKSNGDWNTAALKCFAVAQAMKEAKARQRRRKKENK